MSRRLLLAIASVMLGALIATGCASTTTESETSETQAPAVSRPSLVRSDRIDTTELLDLSTGEATTLAAATTGDRAVLLWFWSPTCVTCRFHALDIEAFAEEHRDIVQVIGVGAWDSPDMADDFIADTGLTTLPMLYETTGRLWSLSKVITNSSLQLVSHDLSVQSGTFWFDDSGRQTVFDAALVQPYAPPPT